MPNVQTHLGPTHVPYSWAMLGPDRRASVLARRDALLIRFDRRSRLHIEGGCGLSTNACQCDLAQRVRRLDASILALSHYIIGFDRTLRRGRVLARVKGLK